MKPQFNDARLSVEKAREALRNGNRTEARQWAEHAASLAPQMEDPWLILAAVASPACQRGIYPNRVKDQSKQPTGA